MDILKNLNKEQIKAVEYLDGPLLVVAGAGSGKTKVLTSRIAYLIEKGINPTNILAITFTNKAAGEMKERVSKLVGISTKCIQISTFHSFGLKIIKENYEYLGYDKNFVIFDSDDTLTIIKKIIKENNIDSEKYNPKIIRNKISNLKNELIDAKSYKNKTLAEFDEVILKVYQRYEKDLVKNNSLDFDDLLILPIKLFQAKREILEKYQDKYKYILIDEYQDTNEAQYKLTKLLASKYQNICCVGDLDQAIYGFRGANYKNILKFERDFSNVKIIRLEENYRSYTTILEAANSVIKHNNNRKEKKLFSNLGQGDKIEYYRASSAIDEVRYVINQIKELKKNGVSFNDIVILYRTNAQSRIIEDVLRKNNIAYKIIGGLSFYSRMEIKNLLAYLRLIFNSNDDVSLLRVINVPKRGIGKKTISNLEQKAFLTQSSLYDAIDSGNELLFKNIIEDLKSKKDTMSLVDFIDLVLDISGIRKELENEKTLESEVRLENLEEFKSVAKAFENENGVVSLEDFLLNISLINDNTEVKEINNVISLMTIHAVKGLEFDYVFIVGLEEGIFPHQNSLCSDEEIEEERRLCYVAITRCKKKLFLTNSRIRIMYGVEQGYPISRFINEIDGNLLNYANNLNSNNKFNFSVKNDENFHNLDYNNNINEKSNVSKNYLKKECDYQVGDLVYHENFGMGSVVDIIEDKKDISKTLLKIAFKMPYGIKTLIYNHKNLRKV